MIDFHTHMLAHMDDGSRSTDMSVEMYETLLGQGVTKVFMTPHYYADEERPEDFLTRRQKAYEHLKKKMPEAKVLLGAEVAYFDGMSEVRLLKDMCLENTDILLVEMPFRKIGTHTLDEIKRVERNLKVRVLLAHLNRYYSLIDIKKLREYGFLAQVNNEAFESFFDSLKTKKLIEEGVVHVLGSDCHNMTKRRPDFDLANRKLNEKLKAMIAKNEEKLITATKGDSI